MGEVKFGGNHVKNWGTLVQEGDCQFSEAPYNYYTLNLTPGRTYTIQHPSCLIYFYTGSEANLNLTEISVTVNQGTAVFSGKNKLEIKVLERTQLFIVAGQSSEESYFECVRAEELKVVRKPWGKEVWINHPKQEFSLKVILINAGTKTSLQYHQYKTETNVVYAGQANLYFKSNSSVENDNVTASDLSKTLLNRGDVLHVTPFHIHRLEAITQLTLLEASTNHLDDVIRIQDDFKRVHGRIESEHVKKS